MAEGNDEFALALEDALREDFIVHHCKDAPMALWMAQIFPPDVLVLDVLLPGTNAGELLKQFLATGLTPMVMATTEAMDENLLRPLAELGVEYVMRKPCSIQRAVEHIRQLSRPLHSSAPADHREAIAELLRTLRIPVQRQGFSCLVDVISLALEAPEQAFCKELYPAVAQQRNVNWTSVERCIRTAIDTAWRARDEQIWEYYFPADPGQPSRRPTNAEFICRMAQQIAVSHSNPLMDCFRIP